MNESVVLPNKTCDYGTSAKSSDNSTVLQELRGYPLVHFFLGKNIIVDIWDLRIKGKLVCYGFERKDAFHNVVTPEILILETPFRKLIVRGAARSIKLDPAPSTQGSSSSAAFQRYNKKQGRQARR